MSDKKYWAITDEDYVNSEENIMKKRIENFMAYLDKKLQRCQEFRKEDWTSDEVESLILDMKNLLNRIEYSIYKPFMPKKNVGQ